jgi:hypothetical protein
MLTLTPSRDNPMLPVPARDCPAVTTTCLLSLVPCPTLANIAVSDVQLLASAADPPTVTLTQKFAPPIFAPEMLIIKAPVDGPLVILNELELGESYVKLTKKTVRFSICMTASALLIPAALIVRHVTAVSAVQLVSRHIVGPIEIILCSGIPSKLGLLLIGP